MKNRSEIDDMTGLFNKNKYLQIKKEYYAGIEAVGVIFWDVNNLKQTNDTLGHEQGDLLICTTAQMMKNLIATNRKVYRIGGDEFIMVVSNPAEGEMQEIEKRWNRKSKGVTGE